MKISWAIVCPTFILLILPNLVELEEDEDRAEYDDDAIPVEMDCGQHGHMSKDRKYNLWECDLRNHVVHLMTPLNGTVAKEFRSPIGIFGESNNYSGLPDIVTAAAVEYGADHTFSFCPQRIPNEMFDYPNHTQVFPFLDMPEGYILIKEHLPDLKAIIIGPGLGQDEAIFKQIHTVIEDLKKFKHQPPLIFDQDGLSFICHYRELLQDYKGDIYLTPNYSELKLLKDNFQFPGYIPMYNEYHPKDEYDHLKYIAKQINNRTILISKGVVDKIFTPKFAAVLTIMPSDQHPDGQGDVLTGTLAQISQLVHRYDKLKGIDRPDDVEDFPQMLAAYSACILTRLANGEASRIKGDEQKISPAEMVAQLRPVMRDYIPYERNDL